MQRQSLGSPVSSKHHIHGGGLPKEDTRLIELQPSSSSSSSSSSSASSPAVYDDDDDSKSTKPRRFSLSSPPSLSTHSRPEKLIHLIPLITLFCFLVLYCSSHSPSPSDLAQYHGFKRPLNLIGEIEDVNRSIQLRRGDFLAIRSLSNVQEIEKQAPRSRPHRKIGDF